MGIHNQNTISQSINLTNRAATFDCYEIRKNSISHRSTTSSSNSVNLLKTKTKYLCLLGVPPDDYISFYGMRTHDILMGVLVSN